MSYNIKLAKRHYLAASLHNIPVSQIHTEHQTLGLRKLEFEKKKEKKSLYKQLINTYICKLCKILQNTQAKFISPQKMLKLLF
jgi:hypothetical protein